MYNTPRLAQTASPPKMISRVNTKRCLDTNKVYPQEAKTAPGDLWNPAETIFSGGSSFTFVDLQMNEVPPMLPPASSSERNAKKNK